MDNFEAADSDLDYLLENAPEYIDVKPLVLQRINRFKDSGKALGFLEKAETVLSSGNCSHGFPSRSICTLS